MMMMTMITVMMRVMWYNAVAAEKYDPEADDEDATAAQVNWRVVEK